MYVVQEDPTTYNVGYIMGYTKELGEHILGSNLRGPCAGSKIKISKGRQFQKGTGQLHTNHDIVKSMSESSGTNLGKGKEKAWDTKGNCLRLFWTLHVDRLTLEVYKNIGSK
jgi:hypothetical protein